MSLKQQISPKWAIFVSLSICLALSLISDLCLGVSLSVIIVPAGVRTEVYTVCMLSVAIETQNR